MLRPTSLALVSAAFMTLFVSSAALAAGPAPNPPPGSVAVQPTSISGGSSSQPGGGAGVTTGQAGASSDNQGQTAQHCGVQVGTGGAAYSAQPTQVGTVSGTSSPTGCDTSSSGAKDTSQTGQTAPSGDNAPRVKSGAGAGGGQSGSSNTMGGRAITPTALGRGGPGFFGGLIWIGLLLLLALLFLLLGFAVGRRRQAKAAA